MMMLSKSTRRAEGEVRKCYIQAMMQKIGVTAVHAVYPYASLNQK